MYRTTARLRAIIFSACLLLVWASGPACAAPRPIAAVIAERGTLLVQFHGAGPFQALHLQTPLSAGDIVRTGPDGEAAILFQDGSQVKLNANASLRITLEPERGHQTLFQALLGVIWAHLRPGQTIQTPTANIVVRGTEVLLAVSEDGTTTLTVTEGDALFVNALGSVDVAAARQSVARPGQAPTPPVAVDVSGLLAWTADVAGLPLEFEMPPLTPGPAADSAADAARFQLSVQRDPADTAGWVGLGSARRGLGDLPGALDAFAQAERLSPEDVPARIGSALTFLSQGRTAEARAVLTPVQAQAPALAVLGLADLHDGKEADSERDLQAALSLDPHLYAARALLALAFLSRSDLSDAETAAREAVQTEPNSAQTEGTLAMTLFFAGKRAEAEADSRRAVRLNPRSPFALLTEGRTLLASRQVDSARADYEKAAATAPSLWLAHEELGTVYLALDMPRKAAEEEQIALTLNPDSAAAHTGLGLADQRQGRYADAETEMRRAVLLDPNDGTAQYNLAALLIDRGRLAEARQALENGVRAAPERGILYARLAEVSLYQQDLFGAQELALQAVRLLPASAFTHYELGRVYLEQDRTVQAEQEFRQATTLDRQFAPARYALGLTEEKTEGGLLNSFSSLLGSALVGSPAAVPTLENLQTPGANQRIQAALLDPTAVRVASRSYGDTQLDATGGDHGTRDLSGSFLTDTDDARGVRGVNAEEQATDGVRADDGSRSDTASFVFGQKAADSPSGVFVTGDYEDSSQGVDNGIVSDPVSATQRYHTHLARLLAGVNIQPRQGTSVRALVQISKSLRGDNDSAFADNYDRFDFRSLNGELRWDQDLGASNHLIAGLSLGSRRELVAASALGPDPTQPPFQVSVNTKVQPYQLYIRDEARINSRFSLTGEMQVQRLDTLSDTAVVGLAGFPPTHASNQKTFGVPTVIASYQVDTRSAVRLRVRRLFATVSDFQLLTPTDVFLASFAELPQAVSVGAPPSSDGSSVEAEYDRTFANASFVRLNVFQQDIRQGSILLGPPDGPYAQAHIRGVQASYEGLLSRDLSFYLSGDVNAAHDSATDLRIAQVPDFDSLASLQYLNRAGFYAQTAYYYQGNRVAADDDRSHLGGFGVLSLRAGKRYGLRTDLFVQVSNALNKQYDVYGVLQPPRVVSVGLSQRF